jgi:hypothetical protein
MTAAELIAKLKDMPQDASGIIADHCAHLGGDIDRAAYRDTEWHGSRMETAMLQSDESKGKSTNNSSLCLVTHTYRNRKVASGLMRQAL